MPRLPGSPFKFIQKQPPGVLVELRKLKRCSNFLTKFTKKTPVESLF